MKLEQIKAKYEPRITEYLKQAAKVFTEAGFIAEVFELKGDDEYAWYMAISDPQGSEDDQATLTFTILEEKVREGSGKCVAFGLTLVGNGGYPMEEYIPYNYLEELWINPSNHVELKHRFDVVCILPSKWYEAYFNSRAKAKE